MRMRPVDAHRASVATIVGRRLPLGRVLRRFGQALDASALAKTTFQTAACV